jgi:hypothetical protein
MIGLSKLAYLSMLTEILNEGVFGIQTIIVTVIRDPEGI